MKTKSKFLEYISENRPNTTYEEFLEVIEVIQLLSLTNIQLNSQTTLKEMQDKTIEYINKLKQNGILSD